MTSKQTDPDRPSLLPLHAKPNPFYFYLHEHVKPSSHIAFVRSNANTSATAACCPATTALACCFVDHTKTSGRTPDRNHRPHATRPAARTSPVKCTAPPPPLTARGHLSSFSPIPHLLPHAAAGWLCCAFLAEGGRRRACDLVTIAWCGVLVDGCSERLVVVVVVRASTGAQRRWDWPLPCPQTAPRGLLECRGGGAC